MTTKPHRGIKLHTENKQTAIPGVPPATLPLSGITVDFEIQQRASMDAVLIADYQANLGDWIAQAPVTVFFDGETRWLADGFHRHAAALAAGLEGIPAIIHQGDRRDALLHAIGANATHGKPRSHADKRRAVATLLRDAEWSARSDRWIAETAKVSHPLVAKVRTELGNSPLADADSGQLEKLPVEPTETRLGQDGKERALPQPDPEKEALKAELAQIKTRSEEWRAQALAEKRQRRALEASLKDRLQELKDSESVHREHLLEMRKRIAEEERNRPRTDAEIAEHQAKLKALKDDAAMAQTALHQAQKEKADLDKELADQRKAVVLQDRIINDFAKAALTYRETALRLTGTADGLKRIPMSDALFQQVKMIRGNFSITHGTQ